MEDLIRQRIPPWLAPAAIVLGLACIIVGFGLLTWASGSTSEALAETSDAASLPAASLPTRALMVTSGSTPVWSPTVPPFSAMFREVSLAGTGATFTLTIVHSNDTWGYTRPCG
jgi:hypothetical protein